MRNVRQFNQQDDQWIRKNFEKLVEKHAGEYIAVASGKIAFGKTRKEAEEKLQNRVKNVLPSVMQIPHQESLTCAL